MKRRTPDKKARHVRLYHWLMQSPAWHSLSISQRCIYIEIASRYGGVNSNNGKIHYSVREAADELRIGKSKAAFDLQVLQERGFIVATTKGAFNVKLKRATEWRLTEFPCDVTHQMPTKDFMKWLPEIHFTVRSQTPTVPTSGPNGTHQRTEVA